jgi:hypothetical protein
VFDTPQRLLGPVARPSAPIEAGAEPSQHLGHVSDQVVIDLALVGDQHPPTSRLKGRFEVFYPEAGETVAVLDHDGERRRVRSTRASFRRFANMAEPTSVTTSSTGGHVSLPTR